MRAPLRWAADVADDVGDEGSTHIFVPSVMGAGILMSLALVVGDGLRRIGILGGPRARRAAARRRAARLVAPAARAVAKRPPEAPPRRSLRTRGAYTGIFVGAVAFSLYVGVGSTFNYLRAFGPFSGEAWMQTLAITVAALGFGIGVVGAVTALRYRDVPSWARAIVDRTPLGRWAD